MQWGISVILYLCACVCVCVCVCLFVVARECMFFCEEAHWCSFLSLVVVHHWCCCVCVCVYLFCLGGYVLLLWFVCFFFFFVSADSKELPDVTIATQFTADRWESLVALHHLWRGPISAVLFVRDLNDILQIEELRQHTPLVEEWIDFHFVYANQPTDPYPVNLLRAFAVEQVRTIYHLSLDVDFLPRPGLRYDRCSMLSCLFDACVRSYWFQ
jgi:Glycosyl-transferase for dystroglycan